jgi:hypothetical protein
MRKHLAESSLMDNTVTIDNRIFKKKYNHVISVLNGYPLNNLDRRVIKREFIAAGFTFDNEYIIRIGNLQLNITSILNVLSFEKVVFDNSKQALYCTQKLSINERLNSFLLNRSEPQITIEYKLIEQVAGFGNKTGLFRGLTTTSQIQTLK